MLWVIFKLLFYFLFCADLQTLENNLECSHYKDKESFIKDLKKIFTNAKMYNKPYTVYHKSAKDLENLIEDDLKNLKDFKYN